MNLPKKGDTVTVEHYGTGKVIWIEGRSFKVKISGTSYIPTTRNISCYLSDLISIDQKTPEPDFEELPKLKVGSLVKHSLFGFGRVKEIRPASKYGKLEPDKNAVIDFDYPYSQKTLYLPYAKLEIISY